MSIVTKPSGQAHLASAALPAAGAFTNQTAIPIVAKTLRIVATVTYAYGAGGGYVRLRPMWTIGGVEQQGTVQDSAIDPSAAPFGRQNIYLQEIDGPAPSSASAITFPVAFDVQPGASAVRILAAEAGVTGTPGTCAITLSGVVDL